MSTRVISILNMKGGVGKTTVTLNLAYALTYFHQKKVLVVDFDPQANATSGLLTFETYENHRKTKKVISDIFTDLAKIVSPVSSNDSTSITLRTVRPNLEANPRLR